MKLSVVTDQKGKIISISQFGDVGERISGITKAGIVAEKGHTVHEIELPKELEHTSLLDLHKGFRIDVSKGRGKLVKA